MEVLGQLESKILGWLKGVPHLPEVVRAWLGTNVWWIVLVGVVLAVFGLIMSVLGLFALMSLVGSFGATSYVAATTGPWAVVTALVSLAFLVIQIIILAMAIKPLQLKQKKGWVLLFVEWLISVVAVVLGAVLSLNVLSFITGILFGAIGIAISGYFLFEIHSQFAHVEKSRGVKEAIKTKKA